VAFVEIVDEPGLRRLPSQQLACQCCRRGAVGRKEAGQPGEVELKAVTAGK
jgi:hypothetical protein